MGASHTFEQNVKLHDSITANRSGRDEDEAKYIVGQKVKLLENVVNDGTYPHAKIGTLMMPKGSTGYIKDVGEFLQVIRVYEVHFFGAGMDVEVIGCREHELESVDDGYIGEDALDREAMENHRKKMNKIDSNLK
ncbi:MAG: nitrogen fixation protein NifZ [Sulfurimonas sp.]